MNQSKRWIGSRNITESDREAARLTAESFGHYDFDSTLTPSTPQVIRAGKTGGLPFDTLTTDLFGGCLPGRDICYGNCFAARAAYAAGIDFGARVPNILDHDVLRADLERLPAEQKFLRNGWNSDPSWNWPNGVVLSQWLRESGRLTIFNTKSFTRLQPDTIRSLVAVKAELWLCVSAFDSDAQIEHRIDSIEKYREAGGIVVPLVMTTRFSEPDLNAKQEQLVQYMVDHDLPAAENSLRFAPTSPVMAVLDRLRMKQIASTGDFWCGRLYEGVLRVPTTSSLPPSYSGLQSSYLSGNDPDFLESLFANPVYTNEEVLASPPLEKPIQAGVPMVHISHRATAGYVQG
jgi:hypothetical protein